MLLIKLIILYITLTSFLNGLSTFLLQAEEKAEAESTQTSSQGSTKKLPWDTAWVWAYNQAKDRPATEQPHRGRVVGSGKHHKHSYYYPIESKAVRNERKRFTEMDLKEAVDKEVKATVPGLVRNQLQETLSAIMPSLMESVKTWMV